MGGFAKTVSKVVAAVSETMSCMPGREGGVEPIRSLSIVYTAHAKVKRR
jgi:hypothetical protein